MEFQVIASLHISRLKLCTHISADICIQHALPILITLNLSPQYYLLKSTNYEAPPYAIFSIPLLLLSCVET
jgi:hypothetical protein